MEIKKIPISEINPVAYNPRKDLKPDDKEYQLLEKSIREYGFIEPLIWNKTSGNLVGGHQRLKILMARGDTEVEVSVVELDNDMEKSLNIMLNKVSGEWENERLSDILNELIEIPDFDIELTGFDAIDIGKLTKDIELHNAKYKPGKGFIASGVDFVVDEEQAMTPDAGCTEMFKDKKTIMCTFSGGKDSTFALLWAKHNFPDIQIIAVFSDTGVEFPGFPAHVHECCEFIGVECNIIKPDKDMWVEILQHGWPNLIGRWCQHKFIYGPINQYYKEFDPSDIIIISGSRADQSTRTSSKTKTSPPSDKAMHKYDYYQPAFDVDRELQEHILIKSGVPIWDGYDMGFKRTACWMCPGQNGEQAYTLSQNYPGLVDVIRRWENKIGEPLQESNNRSIDDMIETGRKKALKRGE